MQAHHGEASDPPRPPPTEHPKKNAELLEVSENPMLEAIDFGSLGGVHGDVVVNDNAAATTIDFGALGGVEGDVTITDNAAAATIDFGALGGVEGDVTVTDNAAAATIDFGQLGSVQGDVTLTGNSAAGGPAPDGGGPRAVPQLLECGHAGRADRGSGRRRRILKRCSAPAETRGRCSKRWRRSAAARSCW